MEAPMIIYKEVDRISNRVVHNALHRAFKDAESYPAFLSRIRAASTPFTDTCVQMDFEVLKKLTESIGEEFNPFTRENEKLLNDCHSIINSNKLQQLRRFVWHPALPSGRTINEWLKQSKLFNHHQLKEMYKNEQSLPDSDPSLKDLKQEFLQYRTFIRCSDEYEESKIPVHKRPPVMVFQALCNRLGLNDDWFDEQDISLFDTVPHLSCAMDFRNPAYNFFQLILKHCDGDDLTNVVKLAQVVKGFAQTSEEDESYETWLVLVHFATLVYGSRCMTLLLISYFTPERHSHFYDAYGPAHASDVPEVFVDKQGRPEPLYMSYLLTKFFDLIQHDMLDGNLVSEFETLSDRYPTEYYQFIQFTLLPFQNMASSSYLADLSLKQGFAVMLQLPDFARKLTWLQPRLVNASPEGLKVPSDQAIKTIMDFLNQHAGGIDSYYFLVNEYDSENMPKYRAFVDNAANLMTLNTTLLESVKQIQSHQLASQDALMNNNHQEVVRIGNESIRLQEQMSKLYEPYADTVEQIAEFIGAQDIQMLGMRRYCTAKFPADELPESPVEAQTDAAGDINTLERDKKLLTKRNTQLEAQVDKASVKEQEFLAEIKELKTRGNEYCQQVEALTEVNAKLSKRLNGELHSAELGLIKGDPVSLEQAADAVLSRATLNVVKCDKWDALLSECQFENTAKFFVMLNTLVHEYFPAIYLGMPDSQAKDILGTAYRANESETVTSGQLMECRKYHVNGEEYTFKQHLTFGGGRSAKDMMQIYFKIEDDNLVLGYIGKHLPISSS